jgi:hypothetical protein
VGNKKINKKPSVIVFPDENKFIVKKKVITNTGLTDFVNAQGEAPEPFLSVLGSPTPQAGAPCPTYPFTRASIDSMTCDELEIAVDTMIDLRKQAYTATDPTCKTEWDSLMQYIKDSMKKCSAPPPPACDSTVSSINVSVGAAGTKKAAVECAFTGQPTTYYYSVSPTGETGSKPVGELLMLGNLEGGDYTISITPMCSNGVMGAVSSKNFTVPSSAPPPPPPPPPPPAPTTCDVEITNVAVEVVQVGTGSDATFTVTFGGTTGLQPKSVAYSHPSVNNGNIQIDDNNSFTLRNLPAGENSVILYPVCEGNVVGSKSLTKVFTITPNVVNTTQVSANPFGRIGGGGGAASRESEGATSVKIEASFWKKNWLWLLLLGGVVVAAASKTKK